MDLKPVPPEADRVERARQIPLWADRYARNRPLPFVLAQVIFALVFALIAGLSVLTGVALRGVSLPLAILVGVLDLAVCAAWVWLILTHRLEALIAALSARLYDAEGDATPLAEVHAPPRHAKAVAWVFAALVLATVLAAMVLDLPPRLLQPLTAVIACPFLVYLWLILRRSATPFMLLWPGLYGLHAILVAADVPLVARIPTTLAVLGPMMGYGLIAALASFLYGRYALARLRSAAGPEETDEEGEG